MKFLVVDDAPEVVEAVSLCLELRYPEATILTAGDGNKALELALAENPDMIILDIGLPGMEGFEVCQRLRATSNNVPIIMLTVRDRDVDVGRGLALGADDYITKPFSHIELLARVQSVLRRARPTPTGHGVFRAGDLLVNLDSQEVWLEGKRIHLTSTEFKILNQLVSHAGSIVSHQELLTRVWGPEPAANSDHLKVHIQHLRHKLGDSAKNPKLILTEPRRGFRFIYTPQEEKTPSPGP